MSEELNEEKIRSIMRQVVQESQKLEKKERKDREIQYVCPACGEPLKPYQSICKNCQEELEWETKDEE